MIDVTQQSNPSLATAALSGELTFGRTFADLMVTIRHDSDHGWHDAKVVPFAPLTLSPAAKSLHYGLQIFEGQKAFAQPDGNIALFRPDCNAHRFNSSANRLSMPTLSVTKQLDAIYTLTDAIRNWVPKRPGSLYIRPALIAVEGTIGVGPAIEHLYFVIASPVGSYFGSSLRAVSIKVETERTRAVSGGVGFAKTGGNYAASMMSKLEAKKAGFDEVLWLDAAEHRYLEELSAMNIVMIKNQTLITPPSSETILDGVTRRSLITLAIDRNIPVEERPISIEEVIQGIQSGEIEELMAVGTAAVITPIGELAIEQQRLKINDGTPGPVASALYKTLTGIQYGLLPDPHGWMHRVERRCASTSDCTLTAASA